MKLVNFSQADRPGVAVSGETGRLHGFLEGQAGYPGSIGSLLASGANLSAVGQTLRDGPVVDQAAIVFRPPVDAPSKILCVGLNYRAHSAETGLGAPDYPAIFARFANTLVGAGQPIVRPTLSGQLDYEGELVAVIGRRCHGVSKADAPGYIAGYSIFNDASIRDYQMKTSQWTMGKNFDATGAFGPWLVTPDELPAGADGLRITTRLNGDVMQDGNTSDMVFKVADLVSMLSAVMTLEPGDLIVTGTPSGVGYSRKPPVFMKPGDTVSVEIEKIGVLTNPVAGADTATA